MYYDMNALGSIGESVLVDSQNPTAGAYDPTTHSPVSTATRTWYDQLFTTVGKVADAFNPQLKQPVSTAPVTNQSSWIKPLLIVGVAGLAGYGIYRYMKSRKK